MSALLALRTVAPPAAPTWWMVAFWVAVALWLVWSVLTVREIRAEEEREEAARWVEERRPRDEEMTR